MDTWDKDLCIGELFVTFDVSFFYFYIKYFYLSKWSVELGVDSGQGIPLNWITNSMDMMVS